jgi:hypothetical protein
MNSPTNFDALRAIYCLSLDEIERFDVIYANNPLARAMIEDSATGWRESLRSMFETAEACRGAFLRNCTQFTAPDACKMEEFPSVARYLCLRTEQRVAELDAEE